MQHHEMPEGTRIAWMADGPEPRGGGPCGTFWLGGFMSEMTGQKAEALADYGLTADRPAFRFDYSGHGQSGGEFRDGTISRWLEEAVAMFTGPAAGPRVVIGSSMGGWLALLLARWLADNDRAAFERLKGIVLIAPAVDMTEVLLWQRYDEETQRKLLKDGHLAVPSEYSDDPYIITRDLIRDGRNHLLLADGLDVQIPIHILHGDNDPDVPWQHGLKTYQALRGPDVTFSLIKNGHHRLSQPANLAHLVSVCDRLCRQADNSL